MGNTDLLPFDGKQTFSGSASLNGTLKARAQLKFYVADKYSKVGSKNLVDGICIPGVCWEGSVFGLGIKVGVKLSLDMNYNLNVQGDVTATAGFQASYKASFTAQYDKGGLKPSFSLDAVDP